MLWFYAHRSVPTTTTATAVKPAPATAATDARPSIAVLPFENRSREEDDAYFVDGIHDDILTQLTKVGALKVISRTSVEQFRDTKLTIKEIGDKLGVTKILEGGVQRAGDRVRVTVQLIDAATDAHVWAENYDRELTAANLFAIQSDVAAAIANALKAALTPAEEDRVSAVPTQSLEAWEAYQLGRQSLNRRTSVSVSDAERFFRKALDIDPRFAAAYVGVADALQLQVSYSGAAPEAAYAEADKAIAQALELDPDLGEAWASAGLLARNRRQPDLQERHLRRAIELNPNYAPARQWLSQYLVDIGRLNEALVEAERAVELDPFSSKLNEVLGSLQISAGNFQKAEVYFLKAVSVDPTIPGSYAELGRMKAYVQNRFVDAVPLARRAAELDPGNPALVADLFSLYMDMGDYGQADRALRVLLDRWPNDWRTLGSAAYLNMIRGDMEGVTRDAKRMLGVNPRDGIALGLAAIADTKSGSYAASRARYARAYPELLASDPPRVDASNYWIAIDVVHILRELGESKRLTQLLDHSEVAMRPLQRLGQNGYWLCDVQIHALRGDRAKALGALREAEQAGWRLNWEYFRKVDPSLASIRNEPEFKAVFADIERDMARQRAALAARPKDAPLELAETGA